ncbi:MAG TPA: hypothetical protein VMU12_00040 [Candidatus Paceibacterota bacterium]|nr:hypothetical protein [Candidatus Paceibacterota bacterium]
MALSIGDVDVERMSLDRDIDEDEIRAAFGVLSAKDEGYARQCAGATDFVAAKNLFIRSDPDTAFVKHQLAVTMLALARTRDELWDVLDCVVSDVQITEAALTRLLALTNDPDDLGEIAASSHDVDVSNTAIRRLAEFYKKK